MLQVILYGIYFIGGLAAFIFAREKFSFYLLLIIGLINFIQILGILVAIRRKFSGSYVLFIDMRTITGKQKLNYFFYILIYLCLVGFLESVSNKQNFIFLVLIMGSSMLIQYLLIIGRTIPHYIIRDNRLLVNEAFIKSYDLARLESIEWDQAVLAYVASFDNDKTLFLKKEDHPADELERFVEELRKRAHII